MLQKLIYSIIVFMSSKFSNIYVFIFRIIFGRTCYGTTVLTMLINVGNIFIYDHDQEQLTGRKR
jgi:hypothetical protein